MYTLILGSPIISSWSLRPYMAMRAVNLPFEKIFVTLRQPETKAEILTHSPSGKVPALKVEEKAKSFVVWDSLAICETLAERHPSRGLLPDDAAERAHCRSISAEMHSGFPDVRDQLGLDFGASQPLPELREDTQKQITRLIQSWSECLSRYGKSGPYLFGRFSIADCMYAPVVSRFTTYGVEVPPEIQSYMDRIWAHPGMQDWKSFADAQRAGG